MAIEQVQSTGHFHIRSGRFYQKGKSANWFLETREGIELGPFESHAEAAMCLDQYMQFVGCADIKELHQFCKNHAVA